MTRSDQIEAHVRFVPAEVEGVTSVSEVVVFPDRLVLERPVGTITYVLRDFARPQENLVVRVVKRLFRMKPYPWLVGDREWCTDRRYVRFFTNPPVKVYTPPDHDMEYGDTYIAKINAVLDKGGYMTFDMS